MKTIRRISRRRPAARILRWAPGLAIAAAFGPPSVFSEEQPQTATEAPLDEVVVTARKTEESVHDVPMSVQVLTSKLLDVVDSTHLFDLQYKVPGLVVNNLGLNGAGFSLRGIADQGGTGLSVATQMNGVYLGNSHLAVARMFDLDRIEVLKGPQGTLYGRNATGGSINFIPQPALAEFSADVEAGWGSFDTARVQGHVNVPFEKSALRVAGIISAGDGFIRNSVDERRFAENDFRGLRVSYRATPSDRLRVDVMAQQVTDDGAAGELWLPRPDFLPDPSDIRLTTVTLANPFLETSVDNASVAVEYEFDSAKLYSITGYARGEVHNLDDCAGLPILAGCVRGVMPSRHEQVSQEFRLASSSDSRVEWLAGFYFYDDDGSRVYYQLTPVIDPNPTHDSVSTSSEKTIAAFGHAVWPLTDAWRIAGGLRINRENRHYATIGTGSEDSPTGIRSEDSWNNQSWRLDLEYRIGTEALAYAGVSTGFKSGGIDVLPGGAVDTFGPEQLTAYEAGFKARWPDKQLMLNAATFYYDYRDLQVSTSTITDDGLIFETDNAAKAEIVGFDIEGTLRAARRLVFSGGIVWLPKREFVEYRNDRTGDTLSGNKLVRAPEWTVTTAFDYEQPLPCDCRLSARLEYNYRSEYYYTIDNDPRFAQNKFGLLNLYLRFESGDDKWYIFAAGRNIGDEDYFYQVFLQASPGYPATYEAGFGYRF
jgi:iron complex outermembrane receptor protein